jgi:low affinity Fe/Cu permease
MTSGNDMKKNRYERKRVEAVYWAGVLIWAGLVFGAEKCGYLPQIGRADAWTWIFLGAGLYSLLGAVYRYASEYFTNPSTFDYIWGGVLLIIGLNGLTPIKIAWPLVLIFIGAVLLIGTLKKQR